MGTGSEREDSMLNLITWRDIATVILERVPWPFWALLVWAIWMAVLYLAVEKGM